MFTPDECHAVNTNAEAVEVLEKTIEWLNNLEIEIGAMALIDALPNNHAGRYALQATINFLAANGE